VATIDSGLRLIDPHIHQWDPYSTPREASVPARLTRRVPVLAGAIPKLVPKPGREFVGDPRYVLAPYLPGDYLADAGQLDVEAIVHIEAAWHGKGPLGPVGETAWVAGLPFGVGDAPKLGGIVVQADPSLPGVGELLTAHLAASDLVRGVRCSGAHSDDPGVRSFAAESGLLASPDFLCGFAEVAGRGLSFEAWVYSHQLADVARLAQEYPEATIVLDHHATPVGAFGPRGRSTGQTAADRAGILARWRDDIAAVAAYPNVVAKHSGLAMPILGWPTPASGSTLPREQLRDGIAPLVTHVATVFGPDRTLWASNFPMDKPNATLPTTAELLVEILGADADQEKLFRANAARVYRIEP
jgi:predicted TIM-barrel fold metal-dependent hydrolase